MEGFMASIDIKNSNDKCSAPKNVLFVSEDGSAVFFDQNGDIFLGRKDDFECPNVIEAPKELLFSLGLDISENDMSRALTL